MKYIVFMNDFMRIKKAGGKKTRTLLLPLFLCACALFSFAPSPKPEFSYKTYGNIANWFGDEKEFRDFFEFRKEQAVVEIGAGSAANVKAFALLTDSIDFFLEDIDPGALSEKKLKKALAPCMKYKPVTTRFRIIIGTEKSTTLLKEGFDKVLMVATFHEFTYMDEMMTDISRILKPSGKVYILEAVCQGKGHKNYSCEETKNIMEKYGFVTGKVDQTDRNGGKGVYKASFVRK